MPVHFDELIEFLAALCDNKNIRATTNECVKGGILTGITAILGGALLGPVGIAIGGTFGAVGASLASNDFLPVGSILRKMSLSEKKKLTEHLMRALSDFHINDVISLTLLVASSTSVESLIIKELSNYLTNVKRMRIKT